MTKRKKIIIASLSTVALISVLLSILSEYGNYPIAAVSDRQNYLNRFQSGDDTNWDTVQSEKLVIENDCYSLTMDIKTTRFVIKNKLMNIEYSSYPEGELNIVSEADKSRSGSNLSLLYYDSNSKAYYMGSGVDSVKKGQFKVLHKDKSVRIAYNIGSSQSELFTPIVFSKDVFEEKVLVNLQSSADKRKLKLYYKLYSMSDKQADFDNIAKQYPLVKTQDLYILSADVSDSILNEISSIMKKGGYDKEQYQQDLEILGVEEQTTSMPAGFQITLELTLENDGFRAKILTDRIKENNNLDKLAKIYLLEYFGSAGLDTKGQFLVPDGSGAQISLNQKQPQEYVQHFYNDDMLIASKEQGQLSRNVPLPVFGLSSMQGGFFAIIDCAAAAGTLYVRTMGGANPVNSIYTAFDMRTLDQTDIGKDRNIPTLNVYSKHILYEFPEIHYILLEKGKSSLSEMAAVYRNELEQNGSLKELKKQETVPLYLDFLCLSAENKNTFGLSYQKNIVLSDLKSITKVVLELHENAITNLRVRLKGWNKKGLNHSAFNKCELDECVGTIEELITLKKLLEDKGGSLYLDTDFSFAQYNASFDSLKISLDTARDLGRSVASVKTYDLVTLKYIPKMGLQYIISPYSFEKFANGFLAGYQNDTFPKTLLSWSAGGMYLTSDYNIKVDYDMCMTADKTAFIFKKIKNETGYMMTDYGYSYTLPYVDNIINVPLTNSSFTSESVSVPFYQMVVSSSKSLSGPALNITDSKIQLLEMASSASAPYYLLITGKDDLLKDLGLENKYYSLDYRKHLSLIISDYNTYNQVIHPVFGTTIISYTLLSSMVSETVFIDGTAIVVNRSEIEFDYNGIKVLPGEYKLFPVKEE